MIDIPKFYDIPPEISRHIISFLNPINFISQEHREQLECAPLKWCPKCGEFQEKCEWAVIMQDDGVHVYFDCESCKQIIENEFENIINIFNRFSY